MSDPQWKDIVKEEKRHCAHIKKTFQGQVLGYVTPVSLDPACLSASFLSDVTLLFKFVLTQHSCPRLVCLPLKTMCKEVFLFNDWGGPDSQSR